MSMPNFYSKYMAPNGVTRREFEQVEKFIMNEEIRGGKKREDIIEMEEVIYLYFYSFSITISI